MQHLQFKAYNFAFVEGGVFVGFFVWFSYFVPPENLTFYTEYKSLRVFGHNTLLLIHGIIFCVYSS